MVVQNNEIVYLKDKVKTAMIKEDIINEEFLSWVATTHMSLEKVEKWKKRDKSFDEYNKIIKLSKDNLLDNPYLKNIKINNLEYGSMQLSNYRIIPEETLAPFDERERDLDSFENCYQYFYCDEEIELPALADSQNNATWMTVEPVEMNSFKDFIESAHGNVLLLGCGLGYVTYMLSLKDEVTSITVVDFDSRILSMFNDLILPQFENKHKVKLIQADGLEYLKNNDLNNFDCINVDIWRDALDMIGYYLPCLEIEHKYPSVEFSYWLEKNLKNFLQTNILRSFADLPNEWEIFACIAKDILNNSKIENEEDLRQVVKLDNMRELLYNWYINNLELFDSLNKDNINKINSILKSAL